MRLCGQQHADDAAHRGAQPMHTVGASTGEQHGHIIQVLRIVVVAFIGQPIAFAAPDDIRADHAIVTAERMRQGIEVAAAAGETVCAYQHARVVDVAPLDVMDTMKPGRRETGNEFALHGIFKPLTECCRDGTCIGTVIRRTWFPGYRYSGPHGAPPRAGCCRAAW